MRPPQGSKRNGWNIAADTVYTMSSTTAFNVRGAYYQVEDKRDYPDMAWTPSDYSSLWPNGWYQPYMEGRPILYFPAINMGNYGTYGVDSAWWQIPEGSSLHARFNKYLQRHSLKAGSEMRMEARRGRTVPLPQLLRQRERDGQHDVEPEPCSRSAIRGRASCSARSTHRLDKLERAVRRRCRSLTPRCTRCTCRTISDSRKRDAESRPAMGIRGRPVRSRVPPAA